MISIIGILVLALQILGVLGVIVLIIAGIIWLYFKYQVKKIIKNIPEEIKKEAEYERRKKELRRAKEQARRELESLRGESEAEGADRNIIQQESDAGGNGDIEGREILQEGTADEPSDDKPQPERKQRGSKRNWKQFNPNRADS